jgi:hypothetical protein
VTPLVELRCRESGKLLGVLGRDDGRLVVDGRYRDPDVSMHLDADGNVAADRTYWGQRYMLRVDPRCAVEGTEVVPLMACVNKAKHRHVLDTTLLAPHLADALRTRTIRVLMLDPH